LAGPVPGDRPEESYCEPCMGIRSRRNCPHGPSGYSQMGAMPDHRPPLVLAFLEPAPRPGRDRAGWRQAPFCWLSSRFLVRWLMLSAFRARNLDVRPLGPASGRPLSARRSAMVEASGFIWEMNGRTEAAAPTAATAPLQQKGITAFDGRRRRARHYSNPFRILHQRNPPELGLR